MAADLVTIATTAVLSQFLGPSAKHFGELILERGKQVGSKAVALLTAVGREPQAVEPKVLLPLVQAAALETDETLADKWASLLANAADPVQRVQVQPRFVEVLRQLTPTDAVVYEALYAVAGAAFDANQPSAISPYDIREQLGLDNVAIELSVDNLLHLRLCKAVPTYGDGDPAQSFGMPRGLLMTLFGWQLRGACIAPSF